VDWQGKVVIVPLSIDETMEEVRNHLDKRGWTNTFNVWAGDGGGGLGPGQSISCKGCADDLCHRSTGQDRLGWSPCRRGF
jgi:hypothetical protein